MTQKKDYTSTQIEEFANENNYEIDFFGGNTIGRAFTVISSQEKDIIALFSLTCHKGSEHIYTCIYTDL